MKALKFASLAAALTFSAGCGFVPEIDRETSTVAYSSDHTIEELCESAMPFFLELSEQYDATGVETGLPPERLAQKIQGGDVCSYRMQIPQGSASMGHVHLSYNSGTPTPKESKGKLSRVLPVDGVDVFEIVEPITEDMDPTTTKNWYVLMASIAGWEGELYFLHGDAARTEEGAKVLVKMIRDLKAE